MIDEIFLILNFINRFNLIKGRFNLSVSRGNLVNPLGTRNQVWKNNLIRSG